MSFQHAPVMCSEVVDVLRDVPRGIYVDATLGGAGHACALLDDRDDMSLIGIDRDPIARAAATDRLARFGSRAQVVAGRFDNIASLVASCDPSGPVTGVLFDLGVSSPQLDAAERGFSYRLDAPLDMRMNPSDSLTAGEIVNTWGHGDLTRLLRDAADERFASRIASRIIDNRPFSTTTELAEIVVAAIPAATRRTGGHPAKRTFQALRIAVNDELGQISGSIRDAVDLLEPKGRGAVLSYHSGEDRLVKQAIALAESGGCECPPRLPCACGAESLVRILAPKMRRPSDEEQTTNSRSASARLRCFERNLPATFETSV
jgi:16S rRNA (cytosine1402-N4)-methyltransferase